MTQEEPKKLTEKQDKFCREYILCGNASEAYRRAYNAKNMKQETIWTKSSELMAKGKVKARIRELKEDIEELLGITKATEIKELVRIRSRCLKPEPKMVWVKNEKGKPELVQEQDESGNLIYQFDSAGANSASDKILKALGYYSTVKLDIPSNGETIINIIVK
jgi:phage terminase small subunit